MRCVQFGSPWRTDIEQLNMFRWRARITHRAICGLGIEHDCTLTDDPVQHWIEARTRVGLENKTNRLIGTLSKESQTT